MSADSVPLTITEAASALRAGEITSLDLTSTMLERIDRLNGPLGAFVTVMTDTALEAAAQADKAFGNGVDAGPLQGIPVAVKDIIATKDAPTTANSRVLAPDWNAGIDAPVTARLRAAGSVIMGKSTTSEFALGMPDASKGFPIPHNPWNVLHTAAGSSSGTGIAVAAGLVLGGLGTDTGGSVRFPAAVNGHTGLKVTFGRVPKSSVVPLGWSLDSIGPMARSAADCALLLQVMAGYDPTDRFASRAAVPDYSSMLTGDVAGVRIGLPMPYFFDTPDLAPEVRDAVLSAAAVLVDGGAVRTDVVVPYAAEAKEANMITMLTEAYAFHHENLVHRWTDYGSFTRPWFGRGAFYTSADYVQAQRVRTVFRAGVAELFTDVDVLITPTMPTPAQRTDEMDMSKGLSRASFAGQWNLAGLPAVAVPCGFSESGLRLSFQIVGKPFAEGTVLKVADAYQRVTDHHLQVPPIVTAEASA
jgi:aspartyl-tRNA(Asn)/glutamyl-tRNA(Gln) amidotransferase subunit A